MVVPPLTSAGEDQVDAYGMYSRDTISAAANMFRTDLALACIHFIDHNASARLGAAAGAVGMTAVGYVHFANREYAEALSAYQEGVLLLPHDTKGYDLVYTALPALGHDADILR